MSISGPSTNRHRQHISAWLLAVVGLLVALASALLVGGARSATSASGLIAFTRYDGIYVMRADGTDVRPLRRGGEAASAVGLAWSPDGTKIAFLDPFVGDKTHGIWVMNADGSNLRPVAKVGQLLQAYGPPTWSPDGQRIAFTANDGKDRDIWIMQADGSNLRRLVRTPRLFEIEVEWSPAGGRVVVSSDGYFPHVYVIGTNGSNLRRLSPRGFEAVEPSWSPDGRRIAFTGLGRDLHLDDEIYVSDASGRSRVQLTSNNVMDHYPVWSPDGGRIAFLRGDGEGCWFNCPAETRASSEIYVMNADGTEVTRLTHNRLGEGSPAWRPVGAR